LYILYECYDFEGARNLDWAVYVVSVEIAVRSLSPYYLFRPMYLVVFGFNILVGKRQMRKMYEIVSQYRYRYVRTKIRQSDGSALDEGDINTGLDHIILGYFYMKVFALLIPIMAILSNKPITNATNSWPPLAVAQSTATFATNLSVSIAEEKGIDKGKRWNFF
jgi:hypothetical protein